MFHLFFGRSVFSPSPPPSPKEGDQRPLLPRSRLSPSSVTERGGTSPSMELGGISPASSSSSSWPGAATTLQANALPVLQGAAAASTRAFIPGQPDPKSAAASPRTPPQPHAATSAPQPARDRGDPLGTIPSDPFLRSCTGGTGAGAGGHPPGSPHSCTWALGAASAWAGAPQHPWVPPHSTLTPPSSLIIRFFSTHHPQQHRCRCFPYVFPPLLARPLRRLANFLAPGTRRSPRSRERSAGQRQPLPGTRMGNKKKKTTKVRKKPNRPPVSAMHPGFLYIICVI